MVLRMNGLGSGGGIVLCHTALPCPALPGPRSPSLRAAEPIPRPALSGGGEARIKSAQEHAELRAVVCDGLVFTDLDLWADSEQSESETGPWPSLDVSTSEVLKTNALSKSLDGGAVPPRTAVRCRTP